MTTHILQVRDLIEQLAQHRQEAPVVFAVGGQSFAFDRAQKNHYGQVIVSGFGKPSEDAERAVELLEELKRIQNGKLTKEEREDSMDSLMEDVLEYLVEV